MATAYLDPNSNVTNGFDQNGYTKVDDGVRQPTAPTGGTNEYIADADKPGGSTEEHGCENLSAVAGATTNWVRLWFYIGVGGTDSITGHEIKLNNTWLGTHDSLGSSGSWHYRQWNVSQSMASTVTNNGYRMNSPSMSNGDGTYQIWGMYIEVDYTVTTTTPDPGGDEEPQKPGAFLLFLD